MSEDSRLAGEIMEKVGELNKLIASAARKQVIVDIGASDAEYLCMPNEKTIMTHSPQFHIYSISRVLTPEPI